MGNELPRLVDRMVTSYLADKRTQHIDREFLPSRSAIVEITALLLELTYPGLVGRQGLTRHSIKSHVRELMSRLWEQLVDQIGQCLCYERERRDESDDVTQSTCRDRAVELAGAFVERLPTIREMLAGDVQAAYDGDPSAESTEATILSYPGVLAITIHRYAHELYRAGVPIMPRIMSEHSHHLTGIDIHPGAKIGLNFFIDHGSGVVIGETAVVGDGVKIYQGVTLGALSFRRDARGRIVRKAKRHPTVGDNVTIYANASILGGETVIGERAVIGGSVFLTGSVPPGQRVTLAAPSLEFREPSKNDSYHGDYTI